MFTNPLGKRSPLNGVTEESIIPTGLHAGVECEPLIVYDQLKQGTSTTEEDVIIVRITAGLYQTELLIIN
jgi:hypothetical protein